MPTVDFHIHLAAYTSFHQGAYQWFARSFPSIQAYEVFSQKYADPQAFLSLMDQAGLDYGVILAEVSPLTTGIAGNDLVASFCQASPRLIPFATFNPSLQGDMAGALREAVQAHGFKGLKLYPTYNHFYPNDPIMYPLYAEAQALGLPILFHTGSSIFPNSRIKYGNPLFYDDIAIDFPDLTIIMAHGGRGPWYEEAMTMIRLHQNIFIDLAGLPPKNLLTYFPEMDRFGHKFVFGSDWPGADMKDNMEALKKLPLSRESREGILGENARKILSLPG